MNHSDTISYAEARHLDRRLPFPASLDSNHLIHTDNDRSLFIFNEETQEEISIKVCYPNVNDPLLHYKILPSDHILSLPEFDKVVDGEQLVAVLVFHERYGTNVMPFFVNVATGDMSLTGLPWCIDYPEAMAFQLSEDGKQLRVLFRSEKFKSVWEVKDVPESWFI